MARHNNFLLGNGERLTGVVHVPSTGGPKNPPYEFAKARRRLANKLHVATELFDALPKDACPDDEVVATITMHPRYVSKSDFPDQLLRAVGVRPIGSRSISIQPEAWGIDDHPEQPVVTDQLFVAGSRRAFAAWGSSVSRWDSSHAGAEELTRIEDVAAFMPDEKLRNIPSGSKLAMFELVLHNDSVGDVMKVFAQYARRHKADPLLERARTVGRLTFVPVRSYPEQAHELAEFSFVRVVRGMPTLRPIAPTFTRAAAPRRVALPDEDAVGHSKAVVFDGGLPDGHGLDQWVTLIEPGGIGKPVPDAQAHGLAVTGALLFGHLDGPAVERPFCAIDHVRVIDVNTGSNDLEILDVLDRVVSYIRDRGSDYRFMNLSLGPNLPVEDDEVTLWTATIDEMLVNRDLVVTVAAGNEGEADADSGLNRVQVPADAVNVLAVGAADRTGDNWRRASYSCPGPGRSPGVVKPDGVIFGGSDAEPFFVLSPNAQRIGTQGTSFASPLTLRTMTGMDAALPNELSVLTMRALMIHRADRATHDVSEVGWGRFEADVDQMVTCDDDEAIVIFQGLLPVGEHLRTPLPLPDGAIDGLLTLSATLLITPEVDPENVSAYTRSGLEISFRPNSQRFRGQQNGRQSAHPTTKPFFSPGKMYREAEFELRDDGAKWEPCRKNVQRFQANKLDKPVFDIYYHHRDRAQKSDNVKPIAYSLVVGMHAPKVPDFYARVVRTYSNVLVPLKPQIRIRVRA